MNLISTFPSIIADASPGVITYFNQSNFSGKLIVLALMAFSLVAWTLMIGKYLELKKLREQNDAVDFILEKSPSVLSTKATVGPFSNLVKTVLDTYSDFTGLEDPVKGRLLLLTQAESALNRQVARESAVYESKMVMLGSILSGAPFLGLLGTAWGVMDAFGSMGLAGSASLQSLAPGVSGALLTTVAALLVAIPSVFGYNFLASKTKQMVIELENFSSVLLDQVELELNQ